MLGFMELLSPAGNLEKLEYAYRYGADAAYIGIGNFSLRAKADNFKDDEHLEIARIKGNKKLYCALNIYFHNDDIVRLRENLPYFRLYPFDAFIISDPGIIPVIRSNFPHAELHLSTQANSLNSDSVKFYRDTGFSRVILGRETSLKEIEQIRHDVPDVELETFVHGAMCLAYSGRCFLSAWMTGRSGNDGTCAHSCRWNYKLHLEEEERPGEYYPVYEGDGFTSILSSRDLCLFDHLQELKDAGIDSFKIEGRMKSIYYAAIVTRAYRKAMDSLDGTYTGDLSGFREDLFRVSHREYSTGFYFDDRDIQKPTEISYQREYQFLGAVGKEVSPCRFELSPKNKIKTSEALEYIGPDMLFLEEKAFRLFNEKGEECDQADHGKKYILQTRSPVEEGFLIRRKKGPEEKASV